jgi:hypothetical protein
MAGHDRACQEKGRSRVDLFLHDRATIGIAFSIRPDRLASRSLSHPASMPQTSRTWRGHCQSLGFAEETRTRARRVMARLASSASGWLHARAADLPNGVQAFSMACAAAVGLPPRTRHRCWDSVPSRCSTRPARWQEGWEECGERWHGWQRTPPGSGESAEAKRRPSAEPVLTTDLASAPLSELPTRDDGTADPTEVWIAESICCRWPSE